MDRLDPIGKWRDDFNTAKLMSVIINIVNVLYPKKGHKPEVVSPIDFMPDWTGEEEEDMVKRQPIDEMKQIFLGLSKLPAKRLEVANKPPVRAPNRKAKKS